MARQRSNRLWRRGRILWTWYRGERRSTGCVDPVAARTTIAEWERIDASPAYAAATATTLGVACQRAIGVLRDKGRAGATLGYVEQKAGHLLRVLGDDLPLARVTAKAVDSYVETRRGETASAHTIAKELGVLRQVLRIARRRGEYDADPRAVLPLGFAPEYEPRTRRLTEDEAARLLAALAPERAAWVAFAIATGARLGEVVRARREDVRLDDGRVHLRGTKTARALRDVPVTALARPLLERALRDADGPRGGPLFSPWQNVLRDLARACGRCKPKLAPVTPNDLRRTHAGWLRSRGVDAETVADVLGHVDAKMVRQVYGKLTADELGAVIGAALDRHENRHSGANGARADMAQRRGVAPESPAPECWPFNPSAAGSSPAQPTEKCGKSGPIARAAASADRRRVRGDRHRNRHSRAGRAWARLDDAERAALWQATATHAALRAMLAYAMRPRPTERGLATRLARCGAALGVDAQKSAAKR